MELQTDWLQVEVSITSLSSLGSFTLLNGSELRMTLTYGYRVILQDILKDTDEEMHRTRHVGRGMELACLPKEPLKLVFRGLYGNFIV